MLPALLQRPRFFTSRVTSKTRWPSTPRRSAGPQGRGLEPRRCQLPTKTNKAAPRSAGKPLLASASIPQLVRPRGCLPQCRKLEPCWRRFYLPLPFDLHGDARTNLENKPRPPVATGIIPQLPFARNVKRAKSIQNKILLKRNAHTRHLWSRGRARGSTS